MRLLVVTFLVAAAYAQSESDTYIVAVPQCIRPGLASDIYVDIIRRVPDCLVTVELIKKYDDEVFAYNEMVVSPGDPRTISIDIPQNLEWTWRSNWNPNETYYIRVNGTGTNITFSNMTAVSVNGQNATTYIQTDKAVYKPGQTVHYRLFSLFPNLTISKGMYKVDIWDAKQNYIQELEDVYDPTGLVSGSLELSDEPVFGRWRMQVTTDTVRAYKNFEVKEYVLPRIEVTVTPPSFIVITQEKVDVTITAKYAFGEDVRGSLLVTGKSLYWWSRYGNETRPTVQRRIDLFQGSAKVSFPISEVLALYRENRYYWQRFQVEANVTEILTGVVTTGKESTRLYEEAEKVEVLPSNPRTFKPSLTYVAHVKVTKQDGTAIDGPVGKVKVDAHYSYYETQKTSPSPNVGNSTSEKVTVIDVPWWGFNYKTVEIPSFEVDVSDSGIAEIVISSVPQQAERLTLKVSYKNSSRSLYANRAYSPSNSFLQLGVLRDLRTDGEIQKISVKSNVPIKSFSLLLTSRGRTLWTREETRFTAKRVHGISIRITRAMAPRARLLAYYLNGNGEIVADVVSFNVLDPFENKVSVGFNYPEVQPGSNVTMTVRADPNSMVATLVVDKKVLLLKSGNDITEEQVTNNLWRYDLCRYYGWIRWSGGPRMLKRGVIDRRRRKRFAIWRYPYYGSGNDAKAVFQEAGFTVLTDAVLYDHYAAENRNRLGTIVPKSAGTDDLAGNGGAFAKQVQEVTKLRVRFPETWLFLIKFTNSLGVLELPTTAPDSITTWHATAFAFNDQTGFGITPNAAQLTVVKPFFANLYLPYSVIRGEEVLIQVNIFNYLPLEQFVRVTLDDSTSFVSLDLDGDGNEITVTGDRIQTIRVPSGEARSLVFPISATELGEISLTARAEATDAADGLTKTLIVKPEGVPDEYNFVELVDLTEASSYTATRPIRYPDGLVPDTQRLGVKLVGDVLGSTLDNIDNLLRMSYGCGEQNMVNFAPTVSVARYLKTVGQLTPALETKAKNFISKGYQRQLNYKRSDGSYSAFGDRDKTGSLWLTAFVAKSFATALQEGFVKMDVSALTNAYDYMARLQQKDGSFKVTGYVHNRRLQGKSGKGDAVTAYVLASFLENQLELPGRDYSGTINKTVQYVENVVDESDDLYELAIGAYALTLAGSSKVDAVLAKLESAATNRDGYTFWEIEEKPLYRWGNPSRRSRASTIEATSYVCLVYGLRNDRPKSSKCLTYLASQQNDYGGFVSTQDTVRAVEALSQIGPMFFSTEPQGQVTVAAGTESVTFNVNAENRLELQTAKLPVSADNVTVSGSGSGLFLVSVSAKYNVQNELIEPAFELTTEVTTDMPTVIELTVCARYTKGSQSNMANIEIGLPTGFKLDDLSREELLETARRVEQLDGKVLLYLDSITSSQVCVELRAIGDGSVNKPKPSPVRVFDYNNPDENALTFYRIKSLERSWCDSPVCEAASDCKAKCANQRRK